MKKIYFLKLIIPIVISLGWSLSAFAQTTTFSTAGGPYTYTVPLCTFQVGIVANGAQGGAYSTFGRPSGAEGGTVTCNLAVTPGEVLTVYVGGGGQNGQAIPGSTAAGGINGGGSAYQDPNYPLEGGGGGGGASDIRVGGTALANRVVVAGGGGGDGGNGGVKFGGVGGGTTGGAGQSNATAAGGGTPSAGGTGGVQPGYTNGTNGALGIGGQCIAPHPGIGGGGGGGYYGGGGGSWGGGGGGSSYTDATLATSVVHTQGVVTGDGSVSITANCTPPVAGTIIGNLPICGSGQTLTLSDPTAVPLVCGVWNSSNPSVATVSPAGLITSTGFGTTTITYNISLSCGSATATTVVSVNPVPGPITGTTSVCSGQTTTLSDTAAGGSWASSNTGIATVGVSSGIVGGLSAGSVTISYILPGGCYSTTPYTVNGGVAAIGGTATACVGQTTTLNDATPSGSWTSAATGTATVGAGSGVVTGVTAGTTTISYSLSDGCFSTATVTINPLPLPITGIANVCTGSSTTLSDATPGGTWSVSNPGFASVGVGTGIVTGIVASTPTVTYTLGITGCRITTPVVVNPLPAAITGITSVCVSATTTLSDATALGTWNSNNPLIADVGAGTGIVTGESTGSTTISYTLVTGCTATATVFVNPLPAASTVTGGGGYCSGTGGSHVGLAFGSSGVDYQLILSGTGVGLPVAGSNSGLDFGPQPTPGVYTVTGTNTSTGCVSPMTGSATVTILAIPGSHNVVGSGGYCAGGTGATVGLDGSDPGVKYQLYNGGTPVGGLVSGTGSPMTFGTYTATGTYTIIGTVTSSGCSDPMIGSTTISINPLPTAYSVIGGGSFCAGGAGVNVELSNSTPGDTYYLYYLGGIVSTVTSIGGLINFGSFSGAGTYTAVGIDGTTLCPNNMAGSATVTINPPPAVYTVTPVSPAYYCTGGTGVHVGLSFSSLGVSYALWYSGGPISTLTGTGTSLDFGAQTNTGNYTIIATNLTTLCTSNMAGSASVGVSPLPTAFTMTGGGNYCIGGTGMSVGTTGSDFGVNYQLYRGTTPIGTPVTGAGLPINFGTFTTPGIYTSIATNPSTGCVMNQGGSATIVVSPLPTIYTVTGGGQFCAGDTGVHVTMNNSQLGVNYQLIYTGIPTSTIIPGTGHALDFGLQTGPGAYTVVANNVSTSCVNNMAGSAIVIVNPLPNPFNVIGGGSYCSGGTGVHIGLNGSNSGITYQLYNGTPVGSPLSGSGTAIDFGLKTAAGTYTVMATNTITGCSASMNLNATVSVNPLPAAYVVGGGGNYCAGGLGADVNLGNSDAGINYQLYLGATAVGSPVPGTGTGGIDFGMQTAAGTYRVVATDGLGCTQNMTGTVHISIISPAVFAVTGGGNYCAGGTGVIIGQPGSAATETYQLYLGSTAIGAPVSGTGSPINFGLQTAPGSYIVIATNILYGCFDTMAGTATIGINPLPTVNTVTGGGSYCAGGSGVHVLLGGSDAGVHYQLYNGGAVTGGPVTGTGVGLDFGSETAGGTYTVIATNTTTTCTDTMSDSAVVIVKPLPNPYIVGIENDGYYCASDTSGVHIYLGGSDTGLNYKLYRGTTLITSATGAGTIIDFGPQLVAGAYTIVASDTGIGGCTNNMSGTVTVTIMPLPIVHDVTGGGGFCPGATGVHIGLDGGDLGIRYTIHRIGYPNDTSSIWGTGTPIDFGVYDTLGTYMVTGMSHHLLTGCSNNMFGDAIVSLDTILTPTVSLRAYPGTGVGVYHIDSMHAFVANGGPDPTYQWIINGHVIAGATNASFTHYVFFNNDSVACIVTASGPCGGYQGSQYLIVTLKDVAVQVISGQGSDVKLIPNPNKGTFTVKGSIGTTTDEEVTLEVTNMLGQVLYNNKVMTQNGNIDQRIELNNNLANGMYILNLRSGSQNTVFHFVVEQ